MNDFYLNRTAWLTKQVNMTPYLLTSLLRHLIRKGPKRSLPQNKNDGPGDNLSAGKSDIFCSHSWPRRWEQTTQEWMRRFTNLCNPRIPKPWLQISAHVRPRPWWRTCWGLWPTMEDAILWLPGKTIGSFNSEDKVECRVRPPTWIKPSEATNESSLSNLLHLDTLFDFSADANHLQRLSFEPDATQQPLPFRLHPDSTHHAWPLQLLRNLKTDAYILRIQNQFRQTWTSSSSLELEQELWYLTPISSPSTSGLHTWIWRSTSWRNTGPFSHRSDKTPWEPSPAGFSAPLMWNHSSGLESSWILWTLLATETLNMAASFLICPRMTVLSVQKKWEHWKGNSSFNLEAICTHNTTTN